MLSNIISLCSRLNETSQYIGCRTPHEGESSCLLYLQADETVDTEKQHTDTWQTVTWLLLGLVSSYATAIPHNQSEVSENWPHEKFWTLIKAGGGECTCRIYFKPQSLYFEFLVLHCVRFLYFRLTCTSYTTFNFWCMRFICLGESLNYFKNKKAKLQKMFRGQKRITSYHRSDMNSKSYKRMILK
jgi:hypothetical protein